MLSALKLNRKKTTPLLMAFLFLFTQVMSTLAIAIVSTPKASAESACTNDLQGANDEPGQKDLTKMCADLATAGSGYVTVNWNWDDTAWSGNNSGDACALFDIDNDGKANYSLCAVVNGSPASITDTRVYSCNDNNVDKCQGGAQDLTITSNCTVAISASQPFIAGSDSPNDTTATCTIQLSDVGGAVGAKLTDVCSYPSQQPNSDPSDCIKAPTDNVKGKLKVVKDLNPGNNSG